MVYTTDQPLPAIEMQVSGKAIHTNFSGVVAFTYRHNTIKTHHRNTPRNQTFQWCGMTPPLNHILG